MEVNKTAVVALTAIIVSQLTLFFLKVFNVISWSWGWILAPLWIPYAIFVLCGTLLITYLFLSSVIERIFKKNVQSR